MSAQADRGRARMSRDILEEFLSKAVEPGTPGARPDGLIHVGIERQVPGDEYAPAYRLPVGHQVMIADSLDRARELAREGLGSAT